MPGKKPTTNVPESGGRIWDLKSIQELFDLLAAKEISEFEMEQQGVKIRVRRGSVSPSAGGSPNGYVMVPGSAPMLTSPPPAPVAPATAATSVPVAVAPPAETPADSTEGLFVMKSPIVGTFYASPSPSAPPFIKVGDSVQVGQVICIIEAMKLMNELEAEVAGEVKRIYVESGQPVEYGQSLFAIEPARKK